MLFNSIDFAVFLPIVFGIYWIIGRDRMKLQNVFVLLASYIFYGWWDYRFLALILVSSSVDYFVGLGFLKYKDEKPRKYLLWTSIIVNLGLLGFFKYYHFFVDSFISTFTLLGYEQNYHTLSIILPVGISFYTFQTLSYSIDIYRGRMKPTKDIVAFFAYVSFFPQLVAGPIERAKNLLPQFLSRRTFNYDLARDGTLQIVWGLFKKIVIADSCAVYANIIFEQHSDMNSSSLLLGLIYFTFQIYCDFSGYSDIAIGLGKLMGFKLMKNFDYPFFSRNFNEFWRRWHISLNSWFVDYLYIPLGGSKKGKWIRMRNVLILFTVSGLWHGANWTFFIWGFLFGVVFLLYPLIDLNKGMNTHIVAKGKLLPSFRELFGMITITSVFGFSAVLFRADDIGVTKTYIQRLFSCDFHPFDIDKMEYLYLIFILIIWEWFCREKDHGLQLGKLPQRIRWVIYVVVVLSILHFFGREEQFIYFQF